MKILLLALTLTVLPGTCLAIVRTWNVAGLDVEGELKSITGDRITIKKKKGGTVVVPLVCLNKEDREFVAAEQKLIAEKAAVAEAAAKLKTTAMAKAVTGSTLKLEGKKLKNFDVFSARAPEYYLLYWGGAWSSPCREAAPAIAKQYEETFAPRKNLEVVLLSCDDTRDRMQEYMNDFNLGFPGITLERWQKVKLLKSLEPAQLPAWKLVDAEGNVLADGEAAKTKARELGAGSGS